MANYWRNQWSFKVEICYYHTTGCSLSFEASQRDLRSARTGEGGLEFHKFRTLILINPDVALFAYEKIRRETRRRDADPLETRILLFLPSHITAE